MRIVVITAGGPALVERVWRLVDAGAEVLVREPALPAGLPLARVILHARMPGAAEVAHALHLGSGADVAAWRARFRGPLGVSAHDPAEARQALELGADHAFLSPIFAPRHGRPARGTEGLTGLIALGGVRPEHLPACRAAGAVGVAVLGGIWDAADPVEAWRRYAEAAQG